MPPRDGAPSAHPELEPIRPESPPDDLSGHGHRQLIGVFGLSLPVLLYVVAAWRPTPGMGRWSPLSSISAYYYSGSIAIFTGILVALALLLVTYRGYANDYRHVDRAVAVFGGIAAFCVAFFPTVAPFDELTLAWWTPRTRTMHYAAAAVLFTTFAVFALVLFPHSDPSKGKLSLRQKLHNPRNWFYYVSGMAIVVCVALTVIAARRDESIFVPEAFALAFFALSWLTKGRADRTALALAQRAMPTMKRRPPPDSRPSAQDGVPSASPS